MKKKRELGIYIHIPFCVKKCNYCDFLSFPAEDGIREQYVRQLVREIRFFPESSLPDCDAPQGTWDVVSIFIGGGTPSVLTTDQIFRILAAVYDTFEVRGGAEVTMECNPGTHTDYSGLYGSGVNRLSFGIQSADNEQLRLLGRIHTWEEAEASVRLAREAGFPNISADLIFSLPGQTVSSWEKTLEKAVGLETEHLSAYSLMIEEGTVFYPLYHEEDEKRSSGEKTVLLPDEEEERTMYEITGEILREAGMRQYEISNYAREGFESVHNTGYWIRRDYAGFGLGASSLLHSIRYRKTMNMKDYLEGDTGFHTEQVLRPEDEMSETMFLGLRMNEGIDENAFYERFQKRVDEIFPDIPDRMVRQGLLQRSGGRIYLTDRGRNLSNYVFAQFLL